MCHVVAETQEGTVGRMTQAFQGSSRKEVSIKAAAGGDELPIMGGMLIKPCKCSPGVAQQRVEESWNSRGAQGCLRGCTCRYIVSNFISAKQETYLVDLNFTHRPCLPGSHWVP